MEPRGTLTVVGAENELKADHTVVYAWVYVEDSTGQRFRFQAAAFDYELELIPEK